MIHHKRLLFLLLILVLCSVRYDPVAAQSCTPNFQKNYSGSGSDEAFDIFYTGDKGAIVCGRTTSGGNHMNGLLLKLNDQGNVVWSKSYGQSMYDELSKVKQTSDGGFIAIGRTSDTGPTQGSGWIVRTDGNGNQLWSKRLLSPGGWSTVKEVIELPDGGFAVAVIINDSTSSSDAALVRLDASGNQIWGRSFDNGNSDGFYSLSQNGSTIMAVGYTTIGTTRYGMATKFDLNDGAVLWTRQFLRFSDRLNEVVRVDPIPNGYIMAFLNKRRPNSVDFYNNAHLIVIRVQNDSVTYTPSRMPIDANSLNVIGNLSLKFVGDSSYVFTVSDSTDSRNSVYRKITMSGFEPGFGHSVNRNHYVSGLDGIDPYDDKGVLLAGSWKDWNSNYHIQVVKTDWKGDFGPCTGTAFGYGMDTIQNFSIAPFSWMQTTSGAVQVTDATVTTIPVDFSETEVCKQQDCVPVNVIPEDGCNSTFVAEYWNKYQITPFEAVKAADGYIAVGYNRTDINPVVMKVGFNGKMLWSKQWASNRLSCSFQHIRLMDDGNLLLTGPGGYTIDHSGYQVSTFVKMSVQGDLIWSKLVDGSIADLRPSANGTFTGLLEYNMEQEPVTVLKFTIDADGKLVYKKWLNKRYEFVGTYRRIAFDGTYMYAAGEFYNSLFLDKFDSSGKRIWSKRVQPDGKTALAEGVYIKGDSVYLLARVLTPVGYSSKENLAIIKVGKDGNGINALSLSQDLVTETSFYYFWLQTKIFHTAMTRDGNFVIADRIPNGADSVLALIKFTPSGQVLWAKKFPQWTRHKTSSVQDDGSGLFVIGHRLFPDDTYGSLYYNPLFMHTDDNGDISTETRAVCSSIPFTATMAPIPLTQPFTYWDPTPNTDGLNIYEENYTPADWPLQTIPFLACGIPANCSRVQLFGTNKVCNTGDTLEYYTQRNQGCNSTVSWRLDDRFVQTVRTTDSSCFIKFLKTGSTKVFASINTPCGNFADSLTVDVLPSAKDVTIGADTTICPGNTVLLHAKPGYVSYEWQDGSSDSTYQVKQPGNYFVKVTDLCSSVFSDTLIVAPHPPIVFNAGPDRIKCNSDTLKLSAPAGFLNYTWSPSYNISSTSSQTVVVNPTNDTTYFVKAEQTPGCFGYDTINVKVNRSPSINLGNDTSFCFGRSTVLDAGAGFNLYTWSDGSSQQQLSVDKVGSYSVVGTTTEGCSSYDTLRVVSVWSLPNISLDHNTELCESSTRTLDPGSFSSYLWQDGSTSRRFTAGSQGSYYVQVTDNRGCVNSDTVHITTILPAPSNFLPSDTSICSYGSVVLKTATLYNNYYWSTGVTTPTYTIQTPGTIWLQVRDSKGCIGADTIVVALKDCMVGLRVPSAFTPNKDHKNDEFKALLFGSVKKFELTIYNRWGQMVFQSSDQYKGWDGTVAGKDQDQGVFIWICRYQLNGDAEKVERGTVTLIR